MNGLTLEPRISKGEVPATCRHADCPPVSLTQVWYTKAELGPSGHEY
jgi:hypothetical protein